LWHADRVSGPTESGQRLRDVAKFLASALTVAAGWAINEITGQHSVGHAAVAFAIAVALVILLDSVQARSNPRPEESAAPARTYRGRKATLGIGLLVAFIAAGLTFLYWPERSGSDRAVSTANVLFRDDFENPDRGWDVGQSPNGVMEYVPGQYRISANPGGVAVWSAAPAVRPAAAVKIIATARIASGQGGWGVWCRGTDTGERYEFSVTHAGVAYIKTPGGSGSGTGPVSIPGLDTYQDTRMVAECRDAPNGAGVALTFTVNGKTISYLDRGPLLGPGKVGVHAFSFGDMLGDPADVRFSYLEVDR
jgi:hypothetical protein